MSARPIVGSDVAGVREAIEHRRTGLLAGEGDVPAIAGAVEELCTNRPLAAALGAAARAYALEHFSMRRMSAEYEQLAEELLAGGRWGV